MQLSTRSISRLLFIPKVFLLLALLEKVVGSFTFTDGEAFYLLVVGMYEVGAKFAMQVYSPAVRNSVFHALKEGACGVSAAEAPSSFRYPYPAPLIQELGAMIIKNTEPTFSKTDKCLKDLVLNAIVKVEAEALANPPMSVAKTAVAISQSQSFMDSLLDFTVQNRTIILSVSIPILIISLTTFFLSLKQYRALQLAEANLAQQQLALAQIEQDQENFENMLGVIPPPPAPMPVALDPVVVFNPAVPPVEDAQEVPERITSPQRCVRGLR